MLRVYGHIKDNPNLMSPTKHNKLIPGFSYRDGFDFEIFLDKDNIDEDHMTLKESENLIIYAINKKYETDFHGATTYINPLKTKKVLSSVSDICKKVNNDIFSYQYNEATELMNKQYFLGSACVFGVALEKICLLLLEQQKTEPNRKGTELGNLAYSLKDKAIISDPDFERLLGCAKFRNLSSHTNDYSLKLDGENINSTIVYMVEKYFQ